ncbi:protein-S-isoprenylcysteine O-methyltransferase Ste14 [Saonia flava]|uniref:Protein-S-isoprenylcysteine O-methyltransferase Ste14 n=1 Tax=Saonia flava TaxID=523696 RepID=A0A846R0P6_9FLAO|nr:isoprenylcysteine carboxylmethyltransferase family protein [Saonia flava]NJB71993.1 protein-S-isoprenylcysteine O-methyltransferase Ste14 [Saonia flava]
MKLKIPPVIIVLLFGTVMYLLARFLPVGNFDFFGKHYLMLGLLVLAMLLALTSLIQFYRSKTTVNPISPSKVSTLVTNGIFQYSRNPMYLALLLVLLVWGLWLGNAFNTIVAAGFVYYMNAFQIKPEEEVLSNLFGSEYKQYCTLVRRWF